MRFYLENWNYHRDKDQDGTMHYFIEIGRQDIEVDKELYSIYTSMERRERYLIERDTGRRLSLDRMIEDRYMWDKIETMRSESVEELLERKEKEDLWDARMEKLPVALKQLTEQERSLLHRIFVNRESEYTLAREFGISQPAVHTRKTRLLKKMRKMLEK